MDNCPACKREFEGIEDFPQVRVLGVEKGDLETLARGFSTKEDELFGVNLNTRGDERFTADEWALRQRVEVLFSKPENVEKDSSSGEYVLVGTNFDDYLERALAEDLPQTKDERAEATKFLAEFGQTRIYRQRVKEPEQDLAAPPWDKPYPPSNKLQLPKYEYFIAKPTEELLGQLQAYVSKLESLVTTVVAPKELLGAELEHALTFREVSNTVYEELGPDSTMPPGPDGKPVSLRRRRKVNKSPRETGIHFGEYIRARGWGGYSPTGGAIAIIKYEGVLDLPASSGPSSNELLNDPDG